MIRPWHLALVVALAAGTAAAQPAAPIQQESLPPLQRQWQDSGTLPTQGPTQGPAQGSAQMPPAPLPPAPGAVPSGSVPPGTDATAQPAPPATAPQWPNLWIPEGIAKLQALDKVNAQAATLTVKVGDTATFGSLTIAVKACEVRPNDQPADAAAFLVVTDSHPDSPGFDGWMLQQEPSVSMMQHPIYDIRVAGCA